MPLDAMEAYAAFTANAFKDLNPMYIIAGDTDLKSDITLQYYWSALKTVKACDPDGLTCFHLTPGAELLDEFADSALLDFYLLEPGHAGNQTHFAYEMPQHFYHNKKKRPIINGEAFYEGHSHTAEMYGAYNEFDQRRTFWHGILAGSKAGIGYGALGLYDYHEIGKTCWNDGFSGTGFPWQIALQFDGGWEGSFAKYIFDQYDLFDIEPADIISNELPLQRKEIRAAMSDDGKKIVVYMPYGVEVQLKADLSGYDIALIDMKKKHFGKPVVEVRDGVSTIQKPLFNADYLLICTRM